MSYILDALKKSEAQRQQGRIPDLSSLPANVGGPGSGATADRPYGLLAAAVVVALLAAGYLLWMQFRTAALDGPVAPAAPAPLPVPDQGAAGAVSSAVQPAAPDRAAVVPTPAAPPAVPQGGNAAAPPARPATAAMPPRPEVAVPAAVPPRAEVAASASPAPPAAPRPQPARTPAAALPVASPPQAAPTPRPVPPAVPEAATAGAVAEEPTPTDPPARVLGFSELPEALRRKLPALAVSGYSYAEEADARMVVINDRMLREGDDAADGVRVERIGAEGVILRFKGYRFRPAP